MTMQAAAATAEAAQPTPRKALPEEPAHPNPRREPAALPAMAAVIPEVVLLATESAVHCRRTRGSARSELLAVRPAPTEPLPRRHFGREPTVADQGSVAARAGP